MPHSANPNKTTFHPGSQEEQLVSGYRCRLDLAKETFERTRAQYYRNDHRESVGHHYQVKTLFRPLRNPDGSYVLDADGKMVHDETGKSPVYHDAEGNPITFMQDRVTKARVCYMWVMSFAPASVIGYEIDPHLVHQIGLEFCAGMEESESETTLQTLKDSLQNIQDLQDAAENLGITDLFLSPATRKETAKEQARLFPMDAWQRRELFLALQEHPSYRTAKFDTITHYEAEGILNFLKGKSPHKPDKLMPPKEWEQYRLEAKYQAIAQKTLAHTFSQLADKPLPDALAEEIMQLHLPIPPEQLSLAEGIHLLAYYGEYPLKFAPAKSNDSHVSPSKAAQLKELLSLKEKQINIPVEQLKKQDADWLFTNLLLSGITPGTIEKVNEQEWENSLWQLSYEQRQTISEYRDAAQKLSLAGYDPTDPGHAISDISQRLEAIDTARKNERELADEYKTLLQARRYVKLADEQKFVKGPKWDELPQENAKAMTAAEHSTELSRKSQHPDGKERVYEEPQRRKTFKPEIDI